MACGGLALGQPGQRRGQRQHRRAGGPRPGRGVSAALSGHPRPADRHRADAHGWHQGPGRRQGGEERGRLRPDAAAVRQLGIAGPDHRAHPAHAAGAAGTPRPLAGRPAPLPGQAQQLAAEFQPQPGAGGVAAAARRGNWRAGEPGQHQPPNSGGAGGLHRRQGHRTQLRQ